MEISGEAKVNNISKQVMVKQHLLTFSVVLVLLLPLALCGCGKLAVVQPQVQQINANTITAMDKVKSYDLNTFMTENYDVIGQSSPSFTAELWQWSSVRQVDISKQKMHINTDIREVGDTSVTPYTYESYFENGFIYYAQSSPETGGASNPWTKWQQTSTTWTDETQLSPQIELMKSTDNIRLAGTDEVNGNDCYIIDLVPSAAAAADWVLSQEQFSGLSMGWAHTGLEESKDIYEKAFQNGLVRLWINKDNNLITKVSVSFLFDVVPGNIVRADTGLGTISGEENSTDVGFEHIIRDINGNWEFSNYNQPVNIQLPQEALKIAGTH